MVKYLTFNFEDPGICFFKKKNLGIKASTCNPSTNEVQDRQITAAHWGSLAIHPSLLSELQASKRHCLKNKNIKKWTMSEVNNSQGCPLASTNMFTP